MDATGERQTSRDESRLVAQSVSGALWFALQTVLIKASGIAVQIALAYLLAPKDFGLIGIALSITAFADALYQNGLAQVVVQRREDLKKLGSALFWLSLAMGTVAAGLLAVSAPFVARLFDEARLVPLIVVLALAVPINSASVAARARLIAELSFARIAAISGAQFVAQGSLSVVFAALGYGALSFALPVPIAALGALVWYGRCAPLQASWPPRTTAWRPLSKDTGSLVSTSWLAKVVEHGDYFILGLFAGSSTVGLYFFAFRLSAQSATIVAHNIGRVLFPALVQVPNGSIRQHRAFVRAIRVLAGVGIPIAVGLVFFGPDLIDALFDAQWTDAAIFVQILSVAAAVRTVSDSHSHLLKAQGRFRELLRWNLVGTAAFLTLVTVGGASGGALGVAWAVAAHACVDGSLRYYLTVRPSGGTVGELGRIMAGPAAASVVASGSALLVANLALGWTEPSPARLAFGVAVSGVLYLPLLIVTSPPTSRELGQVLLQALAPISGRIWRRRRPGVGGK